MSVAFDAFRAEVGLPSFDELLARPPWQADALCREYPARWWFPESGDVPRRARDVCARCLVNAECLDLALADPLTAGVWSGTSARQRTRMRANRRSPELLAARRQRAVELQAEGLSKAAIARELGVDTRTVRKDLAA